MRRLILLGNKDAKRTTYFQQAARQLGLQVLFVDWALWKQTGFPKKDKKYFVKIDPPVWNSCYLDELNPITCQYKNDLAALENNLTAAYFNHPKDITALLDKNICKKQLEAANLPVTSVLEDSIENADQLLEIMKSKRVSQVFIKPACGSGAAGVTAFRFHPRTGQMLVYSCALLQPSTHRLINTKRLRIFRDPAKILPLLSSILSLGCIVERWYPKAIYKGNPYDLRVVCQDKQIDFILPRFSKGPITNLHLNNHPGKITDLELPESVIHSISDVSLRAAACYPGLKSIGIDILLEKGSLNPRIIEMNGQGDLLYQDIYDKNSIYLHQADIMMKWINKENT